MKISEVGKLFDKIIEFYPAFTGTASKLQSWHEALTDIPFELAQSNLKKYVADPDNKYPPHPGALAKKPVFTDSDRYHTGLKTSGQRTLQENKKLSIGAVGPTEEQRRKVRDLLEQKRT
ncbi:hypothetical protein P4H27_09915 [Paenibacillus taichungensis]|uniref:hypothetical protein n=1 Tax=Paenibacillus taichungensis TaxID=484184 RepID=UPI002DB5EF76|nr:hypothetical protein [Paenibacillus taichungensis]MEC0107251.1 hypothetical protein [Paenibacillus taichungensis]MEC0194817.1 hypothetical protein [Paenibacillus taichungensis]